MTLKEYLQQADYDVEETLLLKEDENDYWKAVYGFFMKNRYKPLDSLTEKQQAWAEKIYEAL